MAVQLIMNDRIVLCEESDVDKHLAAGFKHLGDDKESPTKAPAPAASNDQAPPAGKAPEPPKEKEPEDPDAKAILEAVKEILEDDDKANLLGNGSPKVDVISQMVGFPVTAEQRDVAYAAVKSA